MISAEAGIGAAWGVAMVGAGADLETVIAARLAGVYFVGSAAVSAGVEMASSACLDVIASSLHVPK